MFTDRLCEERALQGLCAETDMEGPGRSGGSLPTQVECGLAAPSTVSTQKAGPRGVPMSQHSRRAWQSGLAHTEVRPGNGPKPRYTMQSLLQNADPGPLPQKLFRISGW